MAPSPSSCRTATATGSRARGGTDAVRFGLLASALLLLGLALVLAVLPREASERSAACPSPLVQTLEGDRLVAPPECEARREVAMVLLVAVLAGPVTAALGYNVWVVARRTAGVARPPQPQVPALVPGVPGDVRATAATPRSLGRRATPSAPRSSPRCAAARTRR